MIDQIQVVLTQGSSQGLIAAFFLVFFGGVMTSFTPCIFPMIPIVFSVITGVGGDAKTKSQMMSKVLLYGLGLSISYVVLGVVAVLSKGIFGSFLQSVWVKIAIANVFFMIALNTMGWFRLPQVYVNNLKVNSKGALVLYGFLTGFTMSPCTLPVLSLVLAFAAQNSLIVGASLLWVYAWGFFSLLFLVAIFGTNFKNKMPKSGPWLRKVEVVLFVLCFGIGEWFLIASGGF